MYRLSKNELLEIWKEDLNLTLYIFPKLRDKTSCLSYIIKN
jgi:hypothetical protein